MKIVNDRLELYIMVDRICVIGSKICGKRAVPRTIAAR